MYSNTPLPQDPAEADQLLQGIDLNRLAVFSHGDRVPENIMYDYDVTSHRITAIIDWEHAGCFPYFWNSFIAQKRNKIYKNWETIYSSTIEAVLWERIFS